MRRAIAIGIVFGGVVGFALAGFMNSPALAEQGGGTGTRLVITQAGGAQTPGNIPTQAMYFIKDSRSGGCWLGSASVAGGLALTPAPKEACD